MERVLEPELMDDEVQALAYARADFDAPNQAFVDAFEALLPAPRSGDRLLDLGCGPADIPVRLARRHAGLALTAVDGAPAMLDLARAAVAAAGVGERVRLVLGRVPDVDLAPGFDFVISNSLLHHLPDPAALWTTVRASGRPGAAVLVVDLRRPPSEAAARALVDQYADGEPPVLRRDFERSLLAAFEPDEVRAQLARAGLGHLVVEVPTDRHLRVHGTL